MPKAMLNTESEVLVRDVIRRVAIGPGRGLDISYQESEQLMSAILRQEIDPVQVAIFLIALRMKGESMDEFAGMFAAMQQAVTGAIVRLPELFCLADPYDGYLRYLPVTPFVPAVLAACGLPTLMTGVETVGPKHGVTSHKVLRLAGVPTGLRAAQAAGNIEQLGWAYLDQSQYAAKLSALLELRELMVKRTAITTLERLLMPLQAERKTHMVLGYVHKAYPEIYAGIAKQAGYATALLVKGVEGGLAPALNKPVRQSYFDFKASAKVTPAAPMMDLPAALTCRQAAVAQDLDGESAVRQCLELGLTALRGERGLARNSLVVAAAQILNSANVGADHCADSFTWAVEKVQGSLDNGTAQERFQSLIANVHN